MRGGSCFCCPPPPRMIIGWGYEGPDAYHPTGGDLGGGVSSDPHPIVKGQEWGGPAFLPPPHIVIGWGYEGPYASHPIWGSGGVSSDPHCTGVLLLCPPPHIVIGWGYEGPDASQPIWGMWEGVGGSSDPHLIVGGGRRGVRGVLLLCPPLYSYRVRIWGSWCIPSHMGGGGRLP